MLAILTVLCLAALPEGSAPPALNFEHFPSPLYTYVWRNWSVVPLDRMAEAIDAQPADLLALGKSMGLDDPPAVSEDQLRRSYITIIRRNWHLLPYPQLLKLLHWNEEQLAYTLREDDFLWVKLGSLKPKCAPLQYTPPTPEQAKRAAEIASLVRPIIDSVPAKEREPLFGFLKELSTPPAVKPAPRAAPSAFSPRVVHSYFALYGDTLLDPEPNPYPDAYLDQLSGLGVDGVWLQGVLYKLAPFPWDPKLSEGHEVRLENLRKLVARAKERGVGVWLYLNEPRAMPQAFFDAHPELKGVSEGDFAALCTSVPEVREYLTASVASICAAVPDLAGFFTISASENLSSCWSHYQGANCPHCKGRGAGEVIAEVNATFQAGIDRAQTKARLLAWDWGWQDAWANDAISKLPKSVALMSVSEWDLPIERAGVKSTVGEYSLSAIGPGPRALNHWQAARDTGHTPMAKLQLGTTWELGAVPYIPAVANVAEHMDRLRKAGVQGALLGWTLGGYPSPNLEVANAMMSDPALAPADALRRVAVQRFGEKDADAVVESWQAISKAFADFPYSGGTVYNAPLQQGPANLLWKEPTHYAATMVGIPYDDVNSWRSIYPEESFVRCLTLVAIRFATATDRLSQKVGTQLSPALYKELSIQEACAVHFQAVATQTEYVHARDSGSICQVYDAAHEEQQLARWLYQLQARDSRIGFEATNQYFYVPMDLLESVVNCAFIKELVSAQKAYAECLRVPNIY